MTSDLTYLALTAILTAALWIPYVIAQVTTNGSLKPANYVAVPRLYREVSPGHIVQDFAA